MTLVATAAAAATTRPTHRTDLAMTNSSWRDDELRAFFSALRGGGLFDTGPDDEARDRFIAAARERLAPEVQRRLLADVGAVADRGGIARAALDILERQMWGKAGTWLLVSADPWAHLTGLVVREVHASYRATVQVRSDARTLKAIAKATRREGSSDGDGAERESGDQTEQLSDGA